MHVHVVSVVDARMSQCFDDREVGVGQAHVLTDNRDINLLAALVRGGEKRLQGAQVDLAMLEPQTIEHHLVEALHMQVHGHLVDRGRIGAGKHFFGSDIAEERDFLAHLIGYLVIGPAHDEIGLHADGAQLFHAVLRRFGFHFMGRRNVGNERHVHEQHVSRLLLLLELARSLDERLRFDIADGAADLRDDDVGAALFGHAAQTLFDRFGHVRDHLHGTPEKIAAPFARDQALVDGALGEVRFPREVLVDEALVVPEVEIAFVPVVGHEDLAVLEGGHRSGVDVEVGIHLLHGNPVATRLEQVPERGGRDALPQRRHDAAGHEYVLGHGFLQTAPSDRRGIVLPRCAGQNESPQEKSAGEHCTMLPNAFLFYKTTRTPPPPVARFHTLETRARKPGRALWPKTGAQRKRRTRKAAQQKLNPFSAGVKPLH